MKIIEILEILNKHKVKYAIAGGVAVGIHGYVRATMDLDILIDFSIANVKKFVKSLDEINFKPKVPINPIDLANKGKRREWINEKNAKVISFQNAKEYSMQIDVFIEKEISQFETEKKKIKKLIVRVVSFDELIKMKTEAGRPLDLVDINRLLELKDEG